MQCTALRKFCSRKDLSQTNLCANHFYTSTACPQALLLNNSVFAQDLLLHKRCLCTSAVFTQALLLHKPCFDTKAFLHKTCLYANAVFTQALSLHKHCFYRRPAFTQNRFYAAATHSKIQVLHCKTLSQTNLRASCFYTSIAFAFAQALLLQKRFYTRLTFLQTLSLHKRRLYTKPAFTQAVLLHKHVFYTRPAFTQTLSLHKRRLFTQALLLHKDAFAQDLLLHKRRLYTSAVFRQALLWYKPCLYTAIFILTEVFCNLQTGNRLDGRRNAEGCKIRLLTRLEYVENSCRSRSGPSILEAACQRKPNKLAQPGMGSPEPPP